jgi:GNAT superfamily N-acetyltransferase
MKVDATTIRLAQVAERDALEGLRAAPRCTDRCTAGSLRLIQMRSSCLRSRSRRVVQPDRMRAGVGRRLVEDANQIARERGVMRIDVVANPHAVAFYEVVGFTPAGEAQTRLGLAPRLSLAVVG